MQNCNSGISLKLDGYPCKMGHLKIFFLYFPTPGATSIYFYFFQFCQYFASLLDLFSSHDALGVSTIYITLGPSILREITGSRNYQN